MKIVTLIVSTLCVLGLSGCSFVQLTDEGSLVVQANETDVGQCQNLGIVSATTKDKVVMQRGAAKVAEELLVLARNEAAKLGANAIVAMGPAKNGEQSFRAYRC